MKSRSLKIVVIYLASGILWMGLSDIIFFMLEGVKAQRTLLMGSTSVVIFLIITSCILYLLINLHYSRLQESEKKYRSYFEDNPTPMWIYNRETLRFSAVNDAAIHNYGYSRDEFSKMSILDIRPQEEAEKVKAAVKAFESSYKYSGTWTHKRKDGSTIFADITSHLIFSNHEEYVMIMASDITKRLKTEMKLQDANTELIKQNEILRKISWSQSHDVRRPLASILGLLNVLKSPQSDQEKELCINYIEISAIELDVMIHKLSQQINDAVFIDNPTP